MSLNRTPYIYLFPFFAAYVFFWLIPIIQGFVISLHSNSLIDAGTYTGLENYYQLFSDKRFFISLYNTLVYSTGTILLIIPFSILLAHLLQKAFPQVKGFVGFCLLLPGLTPPIVLAYLFMLIFIGRHGILNNLIVMPLGLPKVDWIGDPNFIKPALMIQALWRWSGFITFFVLSGLEGIPKTYFDIAKSEGAGGLQIFFKVTLPFLKNVLIFVCIFLFIDAFVLFEGAYVLLGSSGGQGDAALLLVGYTYQTAFSHGQFGTSAAMSFSIVPFLMLTLWLLIFRRKRVRRC